MKKLIYLILLVFGVLSLVAQSEIDSSKYNEFLTLWRSDSIGCNRLRDFEMLEEYVEKFELKGKDTNLILGIFKEPNNRINYSISYELEYYSDSFCLDSKLEKVFSSIFFSFQDGILKEIYVMYYD